MKIIKLGRLILFLTASLFNLQPQVGTKSQGLWAAERTTADPPNIILILADDLDAEAIAFMPQLHSLLTDQGVSFPNYFANVPLCCPSRASILRGQYAHNHQVLTNRAPEGGFLKFRNLGHEASTIATWLQDAGYRTVLLGKYLNGYPDNDETYIPPGWDEWYAVVNGLYFNYRLNENGQLVQYTTRERDYETDVLASKAANFIRRTAPAAPFFIYLVPNAPHGPLIPAPRHQNEFMDMSAPRPPSFNESDVNDKPMWVRNLPILNAADIAQIDEDYRKRLQMMLAVDDMIKTLVDTLEALNELDQTYIFFSSDNGFHQGEHRIAVGKNTVYEESIHLPLIVRGPDVPTGETRPQLVSVVDIAPTFAELAGATIPEFVDGHSLLPLLNIFPPADGWRNAVLIEHWVNRDEGIPEFQALRTGSTIYVEYETNEREFYRLQNDPFELENLYPTTDSALLTQLALRLDKLRDCIGADCFPTDDIIEPEFITVTTPNGGEIWPVGSTQNITWTSSRTSGTIRVELSTNGGVSWTTIFPDLADDGIKQWVIPNTPSNNCLLRIMDTDGLPSDGSDGSFTIGGEEFRLTSPNGGENWQVGSTHDITWSTFSGATSGRVRIELSTNGGASWTTIFPNLIDDGIKPWTIPNTPSNNCLLRITDTDGSPFDQGDGVFTIFGTSAEIRTVTASPQAFGAEFWVDISVSSVQNLFGVNFQLNYTQIAFIDVVEPHSSNVIAGPFLGSDLVFLQNVDESAGSVSIDVSRKVGQGGVTGGGVVARVRFKSIPSTPPGTEVVFSLLNIMAIDAAGNPISMQPSSVTVTINGLIVWPGDTNNDGLVNQADVLPLGLCWDVTGPARQNRSHNWIGQAAIPWMTPICTYADANGDGMVNQADILPIGLNWGRTHSLSGLSFKSTDLLSKGNSPLAANLQFAIEGDANLGEDFWVGIQANDAANLFGVSFEIVYAPKGRVTPLTAEAGNGLGDDLLFFSSIDTTTVRIGIGSSRKAGQGGVTGSGIIARIKMRISGSAIVGQDTIWLSLENAQANDPEGNAIQFDLSNVTLVPIITDVSAAQADLPNMFSLQANYPNPFNPSTTIIYDLPEKAEVTIEIFDIRGRHVRTLISQTQQPGRQTVVWDGRDEQGREIASGLYIYRLRAGASIIESHKMLLLR
jgi:arylsulfatase A-like enzyme